MGRSTSRDNQDQIKGPPRNPKEGRMIPDSQVNRLIQTVRMLASCLEMDISNLIDEGYLEKGDLEIQL